MAPRSSSAVGRRIREQREQKGLTQSELAERLGRTATAVSYWENGQRSPGIDELLEIASVFGVEVGTLMPSSRPATVLARAQAAELSIGDLVEIVDDLTARYARDVDAGWRGPSISSSPSEAAVTIRQRAGATSAPIELEAILDHLDVALATEKLPEALSGLVMFVDGAPLIVVNKDHVRQRQRFSIGHELGHILFGHHDSFHVDLTDSEGNPPNYNWRFERAANEFAAALLMPASMLQADVESSVEFSPEGLAKKYDVSRQAMSIRLSALGLSRNDPTLFDL